MSTVSIITPAPKAVVAVPIQALPPQEPAPAKGSLVPGLIGTIGKTFGLEWMTATFVVMGLILFIFHELACLGRASRPVLSSASD